MGPLNSTSCYKIYFMKKYVMHKIFLKYYFFNFSLKKEALTYTKIILHKFHPQFSGLRLKVGWGPCAGSGPEGLPLQDCEDCGP